MAIKIQQVVGRQENFSLARLSHGPNEMTAKVWDENDQLKQVAASEALAVELSYEKLLRAKPIESFEDVDSLIKASGDNFTIRGQVCQTIELKGDVLIDLFIQNGRDFISIQQSELGDLELKIGQGLEIVVTELRFFPCNY